MRLKYKKIIVFVSLGTLFLSLIILSMVPTGGTGTVSPEDAEVTENENEAIVNLVTQYFQAKLTVDMDVMSDLVSDVSRINQEKLIAQREYIEDFQNIKCYVIANEDEDAFRVYVLYDMKIKNINTLAPSLSGLYVRLGSDDRYLVYLSALDEGEEEFIQSADKNMEVAKLAEETKKRMDAAIASDEVLRQFYEKIEQENQAAQAISSAAVDPAAQPQQDPATQPQQDPAAQPQ